MCELLQTEAGQSWQLSYVHKAVYIAIQWGGDGGPRDTDGTRCILHKSVPVCRARWWSAFRVKQCCSTTWFERDVMSLLKTEIRLAKDVTNYIDGSRIS